MKLICLLTSVPIRKEPISSSEKVSALIFGETCVVLEEKGEWVKIKSSLDSYEGYVSLERLVEYKPEKHLFKKRVYSPFLLALSANGSITIPCGAYIPESNKFLFREQEYTIQEKNNHPKDLLSLAKQFYNTPYNWGGRSIFGIDCSGFMQIIFSLCGVPLPRDAYQQEIEGEKIAFKDRKPGDVAYFTSPKGKVSHVGILSSRDTIIHSAGFVREDIFNEKGIFREIEQEQTHVLCSIKRYI
jgi:hypothetical protein